MARRPQFCPRHSFATPCAHVVRLPTPAACRCGALEFSLLVNVLFLAALPPLVYLVYSQDVGYGREGRAAMAHAHM